MKKLLRLQAWVTALLLLFTACAQPETRLREGLTTVLLAGTDRNPNTQADPLDFRSGGQADFLLLLVMDGENNVITPIHIDRDTITRITTLSVLGREAGSRRAQICLAHSFGDGGEISAELLCRAVSRLLGDIPIDYYFTLSMYAVADLNDAIGGVTVTLTENDDFSAYDPEMVPGKTITLMGRQAFYYTTRRYDVGDETNESRQARQRTYINAAVGRLIEKIGRDPAAVLDLTAALQQHASTNMNLQDIAVLALTALNSEIQPIQTLPGQHQTGSGGFVEFIPDEQALSQLIQDVFYAPAN